MRWGLVCAWLALFAGHPGPGEAGERVVFCGDRTGICATAKLLATTSSGGWAKVGNAELSAGASALPPVLYFTAEEYERAMSGLDRKEREEAVVHRRELVSAHPETWVLRSLDEDLRRVAAATDAEHGAELTLILEAAAALLGGERLRGVPATELLSQARERASELLVTLPKGPLAEAYTSEVHAMAELAVDIFKDPKRKVLPYVEPMSAYFVPSASQEDYAALLAGGQFPHRWREGVVVLLAPRDLERSPWHGRVSTALYPGKRPYVGDLQELSPPQLDRRFRQHAKGVTAQEREAFVAELAFAHAVESHWLAGRLEQMQVPWSSRWQALVSLDQKNLRQLLAAGEAGASRQRKARLALLREDLALGAAILRGAEGKARTSNRIGKRVDDAATLIARLPD